jgi:hypothetical protein
MIRIIYVTERFFLIFQSFGNLKGVYELKEKGFATFISVFFLAMTRATYEITFAFLLLVIKVTLIFKVYK